MKLDFRGVTTGRMSASRIEGWWSFNTWREVLEKIYWDLESGCDQICDPDVSANDLRKLKRRRALQRRLEERLRGRNSISGSL